MSRFNLRPRDIVGNVFKNVSCDFKKAMKGDISFLYNNITGGKLNIPESIVFIYKAHYNKQLYHIYDDLAIGLVRHQDIRVQSAPHTDMSLIVKGAKIIQKYIKL